MKNLIITFLFSAINILCFAETPFTEQTFRDIGQRVLTDYSKYLNEEVSPDFTFTFSTGQVNSLDQMKKIFSNGNKVTQWDLSDVKIRQVGAAVIVTGINKHSIFFANSNTTLQYNLRFTYTYEFKNKKWLALTAQHSDIISNTKEDEAAIKKLMDDVDYAFNNGDSETVINAWKNEPNITFIGSSSGGTFSSWAQDYESLKKTIKTYVTKPTGAQGIKSNHRFKFKGNIAIVEFDQVNNLANGAKTLAHNINIFEKVNNSWKVIAASHHSFNGSGNDDNPEEIVKQWIADYNKDGKSFFENNCSDDYIASNTGINGGKFFDRATIVSRARKENETNDAETTNMKSFKSGNLAVVMGNLIWHHKQPDGSDKPDKTVSTFVMQKKNGKWWYVGHHISPLKE